MIQVDRAAAVPSSNWSARAEVATTELFATHARGEVPQPNRGLNRDPDLIDALQRLFSGKCAYCESLIAAVTSPDVDLFRPIGPTLDSDGRTHRLGYWWLAHIWENLYATCHDCSRNKGRRFPVDGPRATGPHESLAYERAVLLDPAHAWQQQSLPVEPSRADAPWIS